MLCRFMTQPSFVLSRYGVTYSRNLSTINLVHLAVRERLGGIKAVFCAARTVIIESRPKTRSSWTEERADYE